MRIMGLGLYPAIERGILYVVLQLPDLERGILYVVLATAFQKWRDQIQPDFRHVSVMK